MVDEVPGRTIRVEGELDVRVRVLSITYRLTRLERLGLVLCVERCDEAELRLLEGMRLGEELRVLGLLVRGVTVVRDLEDGAERPCTV